MGIVVFRFWELQFPFSNFWISNLQIWILDLQIQIIKNIHLCKIAKVDTHWHIAPCYNGIVVVEAGSQKPCLRGWDTSPCVYLVPAQLAFIWFRSFRLWPQLTISLAGAMERGRAIGVVTGVVTGVVIGVVNARYNCEALRRCVRCLCIVGIGDYLGTPNRGLEAAVGTSWGT